MPLRSLSLHLPLFLVCLSVGCAADGATNTSADDGYFVKGGSGKFDSSVEGIILDFEFDGTLKTTSSWNLAGQIEDQLLYTIGHLNGDRSVGRIDRLVLSKIKSQYASGGYTVTYHARLPVAWGKRGQIPAVYDLTLPFDVSYDGQEAFTDKYKDTCVDTGAHDVDSGVMWYYYRPDAYGCTLDPADVVTFTASATVSAINTTGKYPEYHKVWEDDALRVVAIFGKNEDGEVAPTDPGIAAYNSFLSAVRDRLAGQSLVTTPASVPTSPGVDEPDVTFNATFADGKEVEIVALLVDNVRTAGPAFEARYESLSADADLIIYNGHAGLGANIRALASKGRWKAGQYAIVFMNGCDTYAYIDSSLADAHRAINPDDPKGTKYLDIVTNGMPAFFHSLRRDTMALVNGLLSYEAPQTYEQMFQLVDPAQVVLVSGEEDNVYFPGYGETPGPVDPAWTGLDESASLSLDQTHRYETPILPAGSYRFDTTGTGDVDLYVGLGKAPTMASYDCRPYRNGSTETCLVDLPSPAKIHIMVHAYDGPSTYRVTGKPNP
ncbi:MAG: PPC domain-containing protein [Myxococcales bacterium]|nr:PPC domain-containing protein [Myxococcales bacterium]